MKIPRVTLSLIITAPFCFVVVASPVDGPQLLGKARTIDIITPTDVRVAVVRKDKEFAGELADPAGRAAVTIAL